MKTPLKSVLATFVALSLSIFLSGCFDEGAKTVSQGDAVSSSVSDPGKVKLVLKPGARFVYMHFSNRTSAEQQRDVIHRTFSEQGISSYELKVSGSGSEVLLFVEARQIEKNVSVLLDSDNLMDIYVKSSSGQMAAWNPSVGSEVKYAAG